ncbi:MAG: nucleobase:cation symporter-2 family protein [Acidaminobacteraceae bacterium]
MELQSDVKATKKGSSELIYKIDDKPPLAIAIPLAIQHIVAAFSGIVAVPLVVGGVLGLPFEQMTYLVNMALFMAGVTTVMQTVGFGPKKFRVGSRLPCVMGTDFTFVGPAIAVGFAGGLPAIFGATIVGALVEVILSRFFGSLKKFFPPVVTGTVVTLIGLTILPVAVDWAAGGYGAPDYGSLTNIFIALTVMAIIVVLNQWGKGFVSSGSILLGIIAGYIIAVPFGLVDFSRIADASFISFPQPFKYGITFNIGAILAFIPAYLVTTVETVGDLMAVAEASDHEVTSEELSAGLLCDGVGSMVAGVFNAMPNTSFSQNVGIIPITGVASRYVVMIAGFVLMIIGVFPKIGALVSIMPNPVLGGAGIIMFGMIAVGGINILKDVNMSRRNMMVVAISLSLGMAVVVRPAILEHFPAVVKTVFESGITTGTLFALVLNVILPKDMD